MLTKDQVKKIKWYRQSGAGIPFTIGLPFLGIARFFQKTGLWFPNDLATFLKTDQGFTWYHYFDYYLTLKELKKIFIIIEEKIEYFEQLKKEFYPAGGGMERIGLETIKTEINDKDYISSYNQFLEYSLRFWENSLFLDLLDPFEKQIIEFIFGERKSNVTKEQLNLLLSPDELSWLQKEQKELLDIADYSDGKGDQYVHNKLEDHSRKYYWLKNDYEKAVFLDAAYFKKEIQKLIKKPRLGEDIRKSLSKFELDQKTKKELIDDLKLDNKIIRRLNFFNWATSYRDDRKKYNQICNFVLIKTLKKICEEIKIDLEVLKYAMPHEMPLIIKKDQNILADLRKRKGEGLIVFAKKSGGMEIISGKIAKEYFNIIEKTIQSSEIKGMTASPGKAIGLAKLILSSADFHKMKKGDILITSMTRPEFVTIMKKAAAIVTDEGGITCHAAIVSRELGIPCITGTQIATRSFQDGDLIDVNANHGLIKVIKKA